MKKDSNRKKTHTVNNFFKWAIGIIYVIGMVGIAIIFSIALNQLDDVKSQYNDTKSKYEAEIGKKYVIDIDTVTVIDYSMIHETFTLSDGSEVNYKLILNK